MNFKRFSALMLAVLLTTALTACSGNTNTDTQKPAGVAVQTQTVRADTISAENTVSGTITADEATTIMLATTAKCTAVYAEAGDRVEAGDILCTLDLGSTLSAYNAARIGYESAMQSYQDQKAILDIQVRLASDNVANTKALYAIGAASQLEVDQAELNYRNAAAGRNSALAQLEAGVESAKSNFAQMDTALEHVDADGNVVAPISGTLVTMNAAENSYVSNAMPLAAIDSTGRMKITVFVSETLVAKLTAGDEADVYVSAADLTFSAPIRSVERSANLQTKLYTVVLTVPEEVTGLLSGMFGNVTFRTDVSEGSIVVPTEAILTSSDRQYVFVVEDGVAHRRDITTGLTDSGVTEVLSGLTGGEELVTVGQAYLSEGAAVRVVDYQTSDGEA